MRILVTGGGGYIGSHAVVRLLAAGHHVVVAENFANCARDVVERMHRISGREISVADVDLRDVEQTARLFAIENFDAVIHLAGLKAVGVSTEHPIEYYGNNLGATLSVLDAMRTHGVRTMLFASSAAVYAADAPLPLREEGPLSASSPYGSTKIMIERILRDLAATDSAWRIGILRFFNPIGAHQSGLIGDDPRGTPTNIAPYIAQVAAGVREKLRIFGDDYDTPDGTAVRDYIHVEDVALGHLAALERLCVTTETITTWNLGSGTGVSVLELIHAFERAANRPIPYEVGPRRAGDIASSLADPGRAERELNWRTTYTVDDMCVDAWRWQQRLAGDRP